MTGLERRLTAALERLSAQYEMERRRQSERVKVLQQQVEALQRRVERQTEQSGTLKGQVERLDEQVTRLTARYGTLPATLPRPWR